jgi:branched-chain amino acid aminotransferase
MQECLGNLFIYNGTLTDTSHFDVSFLDHPYYIYEVFRVIDKTALFLEDHLQRLQETCELSKHCQKFSSQEIKRYVYEVIDANQLYEGNMKIVLYYKQDTGPQFLVYISKHEYPTPEQFKTGVPVSLFKGMRINPNAKVMDVELRKATNKMKEERDVYETLFVDEEGCITEGSRSNVFFIRMGKIITPPLKDVLPGITRKHIMEICRELSLDVIEEKVPARSVVIMEAVFISGTSRKVLPVNQVNDLEFDPYHPITGKIQSGFNKRVTDYISHHKQKMV